MRLYATLIAAGLMASTSAQAATIVGLCNTGTVAATAGCAATTTGPDANWTVNGGTAFANDTINSNWVANSTTSRWITPASNPNQTLDPLPNNGSYNYSLKFDLTGFQPGTASFAGRFLVDNTVSSIVLNGTTLAASGGGFSNSVGWTAFGASSGFVAGVNTLTFNTVNFAQNQGNPAGVRVEFLSSSIAAVPEPSTWAMMILGFGLIGGAMRSRKSLVTTKVAYA